MSHRAPNPWFAELDVDDPMLLQDFVGDCLLDYPPEDMAAVMQEGVHHPVSSGSECDSSTATVELTAVGAKRQKPNTCPPTPNTEPDQLGKVLSLGSLTSKENTDNDNTNHNAESTPKYWNHASPGSSRGAGSEAVDDHLRKTTPVKRPKRQPEQCHNHIIAERQRRQNLSQRFIALSALIPGLKKMDKTSVLGEAIDHMKELKEKLKILEEQNARRAMESVVVVNRSQIVVGNESRSSSGNDSIVCTSQNEQLPQIEARFSGKSVLIKIHCESKKGVLVKLINEVERLNLAVTNTNTMSFDGRTLDITVLAQMEMDFKVAPEDIVRDLRAVFE